MKRIALFTSIVLMVLAFHSVPADARSGSWPHWGHLNHGRSQSHISKKSHTYRPKEKHPKTPKNHPQT